MTDHGRVAEHSFGYSESEVRRLAAVAVRAAASRKGRLHAIVKDGGVPTITALWRDVVSAVAKQDGVEANFMNIDLAAYELIQNSARFDVIVAPNLFGDEIADICGVLVASLVVSGVLEASLGVDVAESPVSAIELAMPSFARMAAS